MTHAKSKTTLLKIRHQRLQFLRTAFSLFKSGHQSYQVIKMNINAITMNADLLIFIFSKYKFIFGTTVSI